jgi:hypothetical protein
MKLDDKEYGKSTQNPILLNSIQASLEYISNLITDERGLHLIAQRKGSSAGSNSKKPVDI